MQLQLHARQSKVVTSASRRLSDHSQRTDKSNERKETVLQLQPTPVTIASQRKVKPNVMASMTPQQKLRESHQQKIAQSLFNLQQLQQRRQNSQTTLQSPVSSGRNEKRSAQRNQVKAQSDVTMQTENTESSMVNLRDNIKQFNFKPSIVSCFKKASQSDLTQSKVVQNTTKKYVSL